MTDQTQDTKTAACAKCGGPIELANELVAGLAEEMTELGATRAKLTHDVCPTDEAQASPRKRFVAVVSIIECHDEDDFLDEVVTAFKAEGYGATFEEAVLGELSSALEEKWTDVQKHASLAG